MKFNVALNSWVGVSRAAALALILLVPLATTSCTRTFTGKATQPNPLGQEGISQRLSVPITIVTGDNEISVPAGQQTQQGMAWETNKPYPLRNIAQFMVVSRDRLRFHIQLEHKWEEYAEVKNWDAYLIDGDGRRHYPTEVDTTRNSHTSKMWDYERRVVTKNQFGDITNINRMSGHLQRTPLAGFTLYRGTGDIVFYSRDIFTPNVKGLRLVLKHKATAFEFAWRFDEDEVFEEGRVAAIGYDLEQ